MTKLSELLSETYEGVIGYTGSKGDNGDTGFTGSKGDTGFIGSIGFTGSKGDQGIIGYTGSQGIQGTIGFAGSKGVQGEFGYTGSQGTQGSSGFIGSRGFTGSQGNIGFTGSQGITGFDGSKGELGFTGSKGNIGFTGSRGATGFDGSKGELGFTGSQGNIGFTGSQGTTGFDGSKGELGFTGSRGLIGFTGSQGDQGNIGFTGSQGEDGFSNILVSNMVGYQVTSSLASGFTAPSTAGLNYIISSIHVTNISESDGWITAEQSLSGGTPIQIANQIPVPVGSSIELLKRFKVMNPSDILNFQANANSAIEVIISYEIDNSSTYFRNGADLTTTDMTDVFVSSNTDGSFIESCLLATDNTLDELVTVAWTDASNNIIAHLSYNLIVPANGSVELLEKPKFIANGFKIRAQAAFADNIEVLVSGKNL